VPAQYSQDVTGLDVSTLSLLRAQANVLKLHYVEASLKKCPSDNQFDLVYTSVAFTELSQLWQTKEVYRHRNQLGC